MAYSTPTNAQSNCLLFTLPRELRDHVYTLAFTFETNDDGSIELNGTTKLPSKSLSLTCQVLHDETFAMCKVAYKSWPTHTFIIDMSIRPLPADIPRDLCNNLVSRMYSFRVHWHANEYNKGKPLRFITNLVRDGEPQRLFRTEVTLHDGDRYWRGLMRQNHAMQHYRDLAFRTMNRFGFRCDRWTTESLAELLGRAVMTSVFVETENTEQLIWWGF